MRDGKISCFLQKLRHIVGFAFSLFLSCGDGGELKNDNIAPRVECPRQKCEVERSCKGLDIKSFDTDSLTHCLGLFISKISLLN